MHAHGGAAATAIAMTATASRPTPLAPLRSQGGPPRARYALQLYADSYTLSGCHTTANCGVFRRVAAHCTSGDYCPGGQYARPRWTDATLCDGAPVYQRQGGAADGAVLFRMMYIDAGATVWFVGPSDKLGDCYSTNVVYSSNEGPLSGPYPPDSVIYGWSDPGGYDTGGQGTIHIVAGDGGGGGR